MLSYYIYVDIFIYYYILLYFIIFDYIFLYIILLSIYIIIIFFFIIIIIIIIYINWYAIITYWLDFTQEAPRTWLDKLSYLGGCQNPSLSSGVDWFRANILKVVDEYTNMELK